MKKIMVIEGMKCQGCVTDVKEKFQALQGVEAVQVDLEKKQAEVESSREINLDEFRAALSGTTFKVQKEV